MRHQHLADIIICVIIESYDCTACFGLWQGTVLAAILKVEKWLINDDKYLRKREEALEAKKNSIALGPIQGCTRWGL